MAATAVGLFANANVAESVREALRTNGIPAEGIRILSIPSSAAVGSSTSTPEIDFVAGLSRDLRSMGAVDSEIDAYLAGVKQGKVLVFATGTLAQADAASAVMNSYGPIEMEEFATTGTGLPSVRAGEVAPHDITSKTDRKQAKSEGARLFSW